MLLTEKHISWLFVEYYQPEIKRKHKHRIKRVQNCTDLRQVHTLETE